MEIIPSPLVVVFQLVPFLVTTVGLYLILFKPMLAYLDARAATIEGERQKAAEVEASLTTRMNEVESRLTAARSEVIDLRTARRAAAVEEYTAIVATARKRAEAQLGEALRELGQQRSAAKQTLESSSTALGEQVAAQVLGRDIAAG